MIRLTETALKKLYDTKPVPGAGLLISVVGGGCSGLSYHLSWYTGDYAKDKYEVIFSDYDVQIVTDKKSKLYIEDLLLDYTDGLNESGFKFNNPKAKRSCGCGESFSC